MVSVCADDSDGEEIDELGVAMASVCYWYPARGRAVRGDVLLCQCDRVFTSAVGGVREILPVEMRLCGGMQTSLEDGLSSQVRQG